MTDPVSWLLEKGISPKVAREAGVRYDKKLNAFLYPRVGMDHIPVGWKVRHLKGTKQYNVPSGIPLRDTEPFIARHGAKELCICEGETDSLALATNEYMIDRLSDPHIIAIPGASSFSNEWAGMFQKFDEVFIFPDPDKGGDVMINKVCGLMARARVVRLDPEVGDLRKSFKQNFMGVLDSIRDAEPVAVKVPLRRTSYNFKADPDVPKHKLIDAVLKDTRLRRRGKEYVGLCPLHDEDTPSFMVDPQKGLFYCHGCRKGGDIVSYFKHRDGLGYGEAKRKARDA